MHDGFHFLDIVFFAMVAAFLVLRLRSVLGRRTGAEKPPPVLRPSRTPNKEAGAKGAGDNVIDIAAVRKPEPEPIPPGPAGLGLAAIRAADPSFDPTGFLAGAQSAFGMIVGAYAAGDTRTLRPLLSDEVYRNFAAAIDARSRAGQRLDSELVRIRSAEAVEAGMDGRMAHVTVRFVSDQINALHGPDDTVVEGDPDRVAEVVDEWTFRRDLRSANPNWELVATRSPEA